GDAVGAREKYREALELRDRLAKDFPPTPHHRRGTPPIPPAPRPPPAPPGGHQRIGPEGPPGHAGCGRPGAEPPQAPAGARELPGDARDLAWLLAMCPSQELRDAGRAVTLARRATALAPHGGDCWRALGAALCRRENWAEAVEALDKAVAFRATDGRVWLLLALAHVKMGDRDTARGYFDKVQQWP